MMRKRSAAFLTWSNLRVLLANPAADASARRAANQLTMIGHLRLSDLAPPGRQQNRRLEVARTALAGAKDTRGRDRPPVFAIWRLAFAQAGWHRERGRMNIAKA
jgi:hypothetical protein